LSLSSISNEQGNLLPVPVAAQVGGESGVLFDAGLFAEALYVAAFVYLLWHDGVFCLQQI